MDEDFLQEFVDEAREHLGGIEAALLEIEDNGASINLDLVNRVFRAAHTIKGGSGFFALTKITELAHKAETILDRIRGGNLVPGSDIISGLLHAFDVLRTLIDDPQNSHNADLADILAELDALAMATTSASDEAVMEAGAPPVVDGADIVAESQNGPTEATLPAASEWIELQLDGLDTQVTLNRQAVTAAVQSGANIYLTDLHLITDVEEQEIDLALLMAHMQTYVSILQKKQGSEDAPQTDQWSGEGPFLRLVLASTLPPSEIGTAIPIIPDHRIHILHLARTPLPEIMATPAPSHLPIAPMPPVVSAMPEIDLHASHTNGNGSHIPAANGTAANHTATNGTSANHTATNGTFANPPPSNPKPVAVPVEATSDESIRVHVGLLNRLMNLAGELVLSRNQLRAAVSTHDESLLSSADHRIDQVTTELQEVIMQTRLQPIGNVFNKFTRIVRELSKSQHKPIRLDISGKDVALDKTILEGIADPLIHMVRNAVDHGIEPADVRRAAGKPAEGHLRIAARHEGGQVLIEIADDGKGLNPDTIAASAVRKGLISAEQAAMMSPDERRALIFLPGLSTASSVTDLSGRGVGMDVVKTNLDQLGGHIEIQSEVGKGSVFRIKLPLTLAIIPSLIVSIGAQRYAIPQAGIVELIRIPARKRHERIGLIADVEVLQVRDQLLPLVKLEGTEQPVSEGTASRNAADRHHPGHDHAPQDNPAEASPGEDPLEIAILGSGATRFGLLVSAFHGSEEVVVKPLGRRFKHMTSYAGATLLGDGSVALILDVTGIAEMAQISMRTNKIKQETETTEVATETNTHQSLLFGAGNAQRCAIDLDIVHRIERIRAEDLVTVGKQRTLPFRGASLPLYALHEVADIAPIRPDEDLVVLISSVDGHAIGLLGTMPVDVAEIPVQFDTVVHRQPGISGSQIIDGHTMLHIDLEAIVHATNVRNGLTPLQSSPVTQRQGVGHRHPVDPTDPADAAPQAEPSHAIPPSGLILLAEDSDFFRSQVRRLLVADGFAVVEASDGQIAWDILTARHPEITLVVTDIEMPNLDGFDLTRRIRGDGRTAAIPVIAVTTLAGEDDIARGKAAGVSDYQVKMDRDALLASVRHFMHGAKPAVAPNRTEQLLTSNPI
jgi:two-component system, chemotaxis family, sensor kinase CheA